MTKVIGVSLNEKQLFAGSAREALAYSISKMAISRAVCFVIETAKGRRITMAQQIRIAKRLGV